MIRPKTSPETVFQALSDPCRLQLMRLLYTIGSPACLCELSQVLGEPEYKLSRHMKTLKQAGLVETHKEGRRVYHYPVVRPDFLGKIKDSVLSICDLDGQYASALHSWQKLEAHCKLNVDEVRPPAKL